MKMTSLAKKDELSPRQRRFVECYLDLGGQNATQAAINAGYSQERESAKVTACVLLKRPYILEALKVESQRRLRASVVLGASTLVELAEKATNEQVRLKAAEALLDRGGMQLASLSQHNITITDTRSDAEIRERIAELSRSLGLAAKIIPGEVIRPAALPESTEDIFN
jgi:phage terminase small subunit